MPHQPGEKPSNPQRSLHREVLRLAVPALGALAAEPLFLLADSAIVGHISTPALAGLALAATILGTVIGLSVFLAYGTTAHIARLLGQNNIPKALRAGVDALYLALGIGAALGLALFFTGKPLLAALGGDEVTLAQGWIYLSISLLGLPAMLLVMATTGIVRGLQNTRITLIVAVTGAIANVPLNMLLVYGANMGIAGSALGTVAIQWGMAMWLCAAVLKQCSAHGVALSPNLRGVQSMGRDALPLLVRSVTMRIAIVATTVVVARQGAIAIAAFHVTMAMWNLLALVLDSLAIAAQALTGKFLGERDVDSVRDANRLMIKWGVWGGTALAFLLAIVCAVLPQLFSPDPQVQRVIMLSLLVLAAAQPLAGYVFVLDGVLIGAGDAPYLAIASVITLVAYAPCLALALWLTNHSSDVATMLAVLTAYTIAYMIARALTLWWRVRTDAWMRVS